MPETDWHGVAVHEAGHVVASWEAGFPVAWVRLDAEGGRCDMSDELKARPYEAALVCLAGAAAVEICCGAADPSASMSPDDHAILTTCAGNLGYRERQALLRAARELAAAHEETIRPVAAELLRRRELDGDGLAALCHVPGLYGEAQPPRAVAAAGYPDEEERIRRWQRASAAADARREGRAGRGRLTYA
jgi:hypothetical protein